MGNHYRIIRELGRGGMGTVYEAWDEQLERRVAVKVLHPSLFGPVGSRERLLREARLAARVAHPHVVRIYRVEELPEGLAIELEYIEGSSLREILAGGPLSGWQAAQLLRQVLEGLAACHDQGVIHCDLKPANLLVTPEGHVFLTDFGISHHHGEFSDAKEPDAADDAVRPAAARGSWGTPAYAPPEAWRGEDPTAQWDLYSAGIIAIEALRGVPIYSAIPPDQLRQAKSRRPEVKAIAADLKISREFAALLSHLVEPDPVQRPPDARAALKEFRRSPEFRQEQDATQPFPKTSPPGATVPMPETTRARRTWIWRACAGAVVVLVCIAVWSFSRQRPASDTPLPPAQNIVEIPDVITELAPTRDHVYFSFDDGISGRELWGYNTVSAEVHRVADIAPGLASSNPRRLLSCSAKNVFFAATTPDEGEELWIAYPEQVEPYHAGLVKDIAPGPMSSEPQPVLELDQCLLFYASTLSQGRELWATNGRPGLTAVVADIAPDDLSSQPEDPRIIQTPDGAYFVGYGGEPLVMRLWKYDAISHMVHDIAQVEANATSFAFVNGRLLFPNQEASTGEELWTHEPQQLGIRLLADITPGTESSSPLELYAWKDQVLFQAATAEAGRELWISDGTREGTRPLADIDPGPEGSDPFDFTGAGERVFFRAQTKGHGRELWVTDGTPEGTRITADLQPGPSSSVPYNLIARGDYFFFSADDGQHGEELWRIDLNDTGLTPRLVIDLWPGRTSSEPHLLQFCNDQMGVFVAKAPPAIQSLFRIDRLEDEWQVTPIPLPGQHVDEGP